MNIIQREEEARKKSVLPLMSGREMNKRESDRAGKTRNQHKRPQDTIFLMFRTHKEWSLMIPKNAFPWIHKNSRFNKQKKIFT